MKAKQSIGVFRNQNTGRVRVGVSLGALLGFVILSTSPALAQSLDIKAQGTNYWLEASAPTGDPHSLQASADFNLWVDLREDVQDPVSVALNTAGASQLYFRLPPTPAPPPPIRVMIIGDSMSADCCGWGGGFPTYFKSSATVINYSEPWTSSKVFLESAEMDKMQLVKPDYVLMQFAWSDGGVDNGDRSVSQQEFEDNLHTLVQTVRGFNGIPILVTLHAARSWDDQGKLIPWDHPYNSIIRRVSADLTTPLIDLNKSTSALFSELGPTRAAFMLWHPDDPTDVMHVSPLGAIWVSRLVAQALPASLGPYLTGIFDPPPNP